MIIGEYLTSSIGGDCVFSPNTDSLGYQPFKGANWALVLGLPLRDTIKGLLLVPGPILIPTFRLVSWACTPIISNPIRWYVVVHDRSTLCLIFDGGLGKMGQRPK